MSQKPYCLPFCHAPTRETYIFATRVNVSDLLRYEL